MINRGSDFQKSKMILEKENILDKVTIIPKAVPQYNLIEYYNKSDVVVDQFLVDSTGLIGQEAMAYEKPLIQLVNEELYQKFYSEIPPILNASNEKQIYDKLVLLKENASLAKNIGIKSREWLLKYHNTEKIIKKYIYLYQAIADNVSFKTLKNEIQKY